MNCLALIPLSLLPIWNDVNGHLDPQEQENLCAQVRQESVFVSDAVSHSGARGLTQFMRPTWGDIGPLVGCPEWSRAFDPTCSLKAQKLYMDQLTRSRICQGSQSDEPLQIALACYNGGAGWRRKERRLCAGPLHPECDPSRWAGHQSEVCVRSRAACHETQVYVQRIFEYGARESDEVEIITVGVLLSMLATWWIYEAMDTE